MGADPFETIKGMGVNLSPWALLGGFIFGVIGLYYFRQGRQRHYKKTWWTGVVMMAYPLFVSNTFLIWCVGIFLWAGAYFFKAEGQ